MGLIKSYSEVNYMVDMDTVIDDQELKKIRDDMYSRKPIVINKNDPVKKQIVIGILLAKSLLGVTKGKTLRQLYIEGQVKIVVPQYCSSDSPLDAAF
jgi:ABC-type lipoprotein release transport system permease subunit